MAWLHLQHFAGLAATRSKTLWSCNQSGSTSNDHCSVWYPCQASSKFHTYWASLLPSHQSWVYWLSLFTTLINQSNCCFWHGRIDPMHKIWCPLCRWITVNCTGLRSPMAKAHTGCIGSISLISNHSWGTLISKSARFWLDLTSAISTKRLYSFKREISVPRSHLMSISLVALVFSQDIPVKAFVTPMVHAEGVCVHV